MVREIGTAPSFLWPHSDGDSTPKMLTVARVYCIIIDAYVDAEETKEFILTPWGGLAAQLSFSLPSRRALWRMRKDRTCFSLSTSHHPLRSRYYKVWLPGLVSSTWRRGARSHSRREYCFFRIFVSCNIFKTGYPICNTFLTLDKYFLNLEPKEHISRAHLKSNENCSFQGWMWYSGWERQLIIDFSESQPESHILFIDCFHVIIGKLLNEVRA